MALDAGSVEATLRLDLDDRGFREGDRRMAEWDRKSSSAQLDFNLDDRGLDAADRKLREWGLKSSTAELKFDVDRASLSRFLADVGGAGRGVDNFNTSLSDGAGGLRAFGGAMQGLQWAGILAGAPAAAAALVNVGGAAVSVGSALSSLSGLIVTIPQGLMAFGQAAGTVTAATSGISDALKAYTTQQESTGKVAEQSAGRELSAASARQSAAQAITGAQQQLADANRQVGVSEDGLTIAHEQVTIAQKALNDAIEQAKRDMEDLKRAVPEATTAEKQAHLNLLEARRALDSGLRDPTTGGLQLRQLRLNVTEAENAYKDSKIASTRAREDANKAEREGIGQMPQVVQARDALTAAERGVAAASRQVADSNRAAARATENLAYQQKQAKIQTEQARQSMQTATTTANVYQQALDNLTPSQRRFVGSLVDIRKRFQGLREVAARNLFPGVEAGISAAMKNFPRLRTIMAETGRVLGHVSEVIGKFVGGKQFGRDMSLFAGTNLRLFDHLASAGVHFAHGIELIMRDAQPFIRWLGRLTEHLGTAFNQFARSGHQTGVFRAFFKETERTLPQVLHLFGNLFKLLSGIGEAAAPVGNRILGFLNRSLKAWAEWSHSITGQVELRAFFERLRVPFEDLLKLAAALSKAFLDLFGSEAGQEMLDSLTNALIRAIPSVQKLGEAIVELISIAGPDMIDTFAAFVEIMADGAPALDMFAKALAFLARGLIFLTHQVPGLSQATGIVAGFGLAMAGVKWIAINSGVRDLGVGLYNIFKRGGIIEQAPGKVSAFMDAITAFPSNVKNQAGRIVAATKEVFVRIGSRLGLITGEKVAEETVGGEVAGQAGGGLIGKLRGLMGRMRARLGSMFRALGSFLGLRAGEQVAVATVEGSAAGEAGGVAAGGIIGRMRGLMGRLRGRLGSMFKALGAFLGLRIGEQVALTTVEGSAAGEAGGGIIAGLRSRLPKLRTAMGGIGTAVGLAFGVAAAAAAEYWFAKKFDTGLPGALGLVLPDQTGQTSTEEYSQTLEGYGYHVKQLTGRTVTINVRGHELKLPAGTTIPNRDALTPHLLRQLIRKYGTGGQEGGYVTDRGIVGFQGGGVVQKPGPMDSVLAALTPGEIVLPRKASQSIKNAVGPITRDTEKVTKAILKLLRKDVNESYSGILGDVGNIEDKLHRSNRDTFDRIHKDAKAETGGLHDDVKGSITDLADTWDRQTGDMQDQTQRRFAQMADTARSRSNDLSGYVTSAMREVTGAVYDGMSYIVTATEKALKAFDSGSKFHLSIEKPQLSQHATGGMIGGQGRSDTVPLLLGMAAPGEAILTRYQQGWVETALRNTFGMGLGDLFATERRPHGYQHGGKIGGKDQGGGFTFPFSGPFTWGRTDMGVDFAGTAGIHAIGDARILSASHPSGWPGTGGLLYQLDQEPRGYSPSSRYIYVYEWLKALTRAGAHVPEGALIGRMSPSSLEIGWATSSGAALAAPHYSEGDETAEGKSFRRFLEDLASGKRVFGGAAERISPLHVHGTEGPMMDLVSAALGLDRRAANQYVAAQSRRFAGPGIGSVPGSASAAEIILAAARKYHVPPWMLVGVYGIESTFGTNTAVSSAGAVGPFQFLPSTWNTYGHGDPNNLTNAAFAASKYLSVLHNQEGSWNAAIEDYSGGGYGLSAVKAEAAQAPGPLRNLQRGGYLGRLEDRLRHLTHGPGIRHLQDRLHGLQRHIREQSSRLKHFSRSQLHSRVGHRLRNAIQAEQKAAHRISERIHDLNVSAHHARDRIHRLQGKLARPLIHGFERAERIAGRGGDVSGLLDRLHIGRAIGGGGLRAYARARTADVRNAMAISRAQSPLLRSGSIFAGGGYIGGPDAATNVSAAPPIYLMLDADTAAFVGRVRAVQAGREQELSRAAGLGRLTPGSIGRKAIYAVR